MKLVCQGTQVCSNGLCLETCATGLTQCGHDCVDLNTSLVSCGSCGISCAPGQACVNGLCEGEAAADSDTGSGDKGGCGCRVGTQGDASRGLWVGLLALGLYAGRRRRRRPGRNDPI